MSEKGREPKATFPDTQRARRRNLHTTLSCMLVYQQLTTQTLEGAGPCHKTWCIVHIAQFSVHSSTRGEHCSQSLPRRGAPEWPKLRALQARRRAESVQMSEIRPLNHLSQSAKSRSCQILSNFEVKLSSPKKGRWSRTVADRFKFRTVAFQPQLVRVASSGIPPVVTYHHAS